jgi:hypothetical protein
MADPEPALHAGAGSRVSAPRIRPLIATSSGRAGTTRRSPRVPAGTLSMRHRLMRASGNPAAMSHVGVRIERLQDERPVGQ